MSNDKKIVTRPTASNRVPDRTVSRAPAGGDKAVRKRAAMRVREVATETATEAPAAGSQTSLFDLPPEFDDWGLLVDRSLFD